MAARTFDLNQQFESVKQSAIQAIREIFPIEGKTRTIRLENVQAEDTLSSTDYNSQLKTKQKEGTWGVPVYASLILIDKATGKTMDRDPKVRLFLLPKVTDRFSYIVNGNEYQVHNQLRLKPGVYTMRKQNGELKTTVNLSKGKNFDIVFKEDAGIFYISKVGGGASNIPLYPVLSYLGMSAQAISKAWGGELAAANSKVDPKAIQKATAAFGVRKGDLKDYFAQTKIDPETTKITLGKEFDRVDGPMLLASSVSLLNTHLGKQEPVDRDSLAFKEIHSIEDFIKERIEKNKATLEYKIKRTIDNPKRTKLSQIVNPGAFSSVIESFFTQDDKSSTPEQTNPLEMLAGQYRATIMGSGGIQSQHAITPEMRNIHPTHFGFIDPVHTPESDRIGANLNLPLGVVKDGTQLKMIVRDRKGKPKTLSSSEAFNSKIAFPGQKAGNKVKVMYQGKTTDVPVSEVQYYSPNPQALFSWSTNLVPYLPSNQGNRAMMAAKMMEQAISLKHREAPLVQVTAGSSTMERQIGQTLIARAPMDGVIHSIREGVITIKSPKGEARINLYQFFPLNRKSFLNHEIRVKVGDRVKQGEILADNNFTRDGTLALGVNLRTAYVPYAGLNFDDGIVITESASKKLTSEHIHKKQLDIDENIVLNLVAFKSNYPNAISSDNAKKLDTDGVIQKGSTVKMGDILIASLRRREPSKQIGVIQRQLADRPRDESIIWTLEDDGEVLDVHKTKRQVTVLIKTAESAKIGDKLSGRVGNKGIITKIIPDSEAPRDKDDKPVDILLNPHGVISRINIGQIYESAAGKAALKTGKPHIVQNFSGENYLESTREFLKKNKIEDKEELFDPKTGKSIGKVHVGNPYILKLFKQSASNFSVRQGGPGHPYDLNMQPLKSGGEEGAKALDVLTMYSMLSHGARANLREMATTKSDQNEEFWKALKSGQSLPPPKVPFVYEKFIHYLKGAGIDVKKDGTKITLAPLTDKEVEKLSVAEVNKPAFFRAKDLDPIKGGFFDPVKLGGFKGTKWGHLELKEPVVNPVFENSIKKVTGLGAKFDQIMSGKLFVDKNGEFNAEGRGKTSGAAIEQILKNIDVDEEIKVTWVKIKKASGQALDDLNKKLRYLEALKKHKLKPQEAYMRKLIPIVPAIYRPVYPLPDGSITSSDVNFLYQNTGVLNSMMKLPVMDLLPENEKADLRKDMYDHVKAVSGLTDINIKGRIRDGFISEIKGGSGGQPKEGFFIGKMLSKRQDHVGRGTIIPEPSLGIDEVALPEQMAWKLFEPFVIRELNKHGKTPLQAKEEIKNKTTLAQKALEIVMKDRKVLLNRAPSLHKFSIMAFKPQITDGKAIKIPPLLTSGFNADFDGDTMTVHVPISDEANEEAEGMLPSKNLYQPGTGKLMMLPSQESQVGLFYLSKTPAGRAEINKILGQKHAIADILDKKNTRNLLQKISKSEDSNSFAKILNGLKNLGEKHAFERGFTLGMDDLVSFDNTRDKVIATVNGLISKAKTPEQMKKINDQATALIDQILDKNLKNKNNPLYDMVQSGAKGSRSNLRSILATPVLVTDARGNIVPSAIQKSYAEGLDVADYWTSMYGARRGMMDRAIQTSLPGAFSKDIMASTIDNVISASDCGTKEGVEMALDNSDIFDRFTAGIQDGVIHNTLVDPSVVGKLRKQRFKKIRVRSPLTCLQSKGTCARCYGLDEDGQLPHIGDNVGAKAGQTISEPLVQLTMNTFHSGGTAGTGADVGGYQRIDQLLKLPKTVAKSASLSPIDGVVTQIKPGISGGFEVTVGEKKIHVSHGLKLKVKVGQKVSAGDTISEGIIKPQDLVMYKGMQPAQEYIVDELKKAYGGQGVHINRKTFETVIRSLGNTTKVLSNSRDSDFIPGDIAPYTAIRNYNANLNTAVPVEDSLGYKLNKSYGSLRIGHEIEPKDIALLKALGHSQVEVSREAIQHAPVLKSVTTLPLLKRNWISSLGYRNLAKALVEGAGQAWSADLEDYHPVPAFVSGVSFGKGKEGKY